MSLQCASPQAAAQLSHQSAAVPGEGSPAPGRTSPSYPASLEPFSARHVLCAAVTWRRRGEISVLLFGPQGEEPVVDSTLQREGVAQRGQRTARSEQEA
ncbi:hypothetical protein OYC64_005172 [Pagothenia borchgrevinki]|uniref:Uncharacterized protein n=1 Tax=Pagothenia borchgrevinki TaxID=8213 RepID=A0ABD2GFC4_PAGBO